MCAKSAASSTLDRSPRLRSTAARWCSTVLGLRNSAAATSLLVAPLATSSATRVSWEVRAVRGPSLRSARWPVPASSSMATVSQWVWCIAAKSVLAPDQLSPGRYPLPGAPQAHAVQQPGHRHLQGVEEGRPRQCQRCLERFGRAVEVIGHQRAAAQDQRLHLRTKVWILGCVEPVGQLHRVAEPPDGEVRLDEHRSHPQRLQRRTDPAVLPQLLLEDRDHRRMITTAPGHVGHGVRDGRARRDAAELGCGHQSATHLGGFVVPPSARALLGEHLQANSRIAAVSQHFGQFDRLSGVGVGGDVVAEHGRPGGDERQPERQLG